MSIRSFFADLFDRSGESGSSDPGPSINPATGLPMPGGMVDVAGNPYGINLHRHDDASSASSAFADHHRRYDHHHAGSSTHHDWSSSSGAGVSDSWPDHSSGSSSSSMGGGYDPSRGW